MKNLSNNDIWILRTFSKINTFINTEHTNVYEEMIALIKHINKMTYRNRTTNLRKVYDYLRAASTEYNRGEESFTEFYNSGRLQKYATEIANEFSEELAEVTAA